MLTSELVNNAVLHGAPPLTLAVHLQAGTGRVRVEVRDTDPQLLPEPASERSSTREHGRGLQIIAARAAEWGSRSCPFEPGKISRLELDPT